MFEIASVDTEKVKIFGKEYEAKKPTVKQVMLLQENLKAEANTMKVMLDFFQDIGLPKDQLENVSIIQLQGLIEHFSGSKKN